MKKRLLCEFAICSLLIFGLCAMPKAEGAKATVIKQEVQKETPSAPTPKPQEKKQGMRVWINRIEVNAPVVPVGLRADGAMDIPKKVYEVGWYSLGAAPGKQGNVVLAGHLNAPGGVKGVFWDLEDLQPGDEVLVGSTQETAIRYVINDVSSYAYEDFPLENVFGSSYGNVLRLITCDGSWNSSKKMYDNRLVVTAVQAPSTTAYTE